MKISTQTRYGARALAELAAAYPDASLSVKTLAERQRLSVKYLEQIMTRLRAAGLVKSTRGKRGGYVLSRAPESITMKEVFEALEGSCALVDCVDQDGRCPLAAVCPTQDMWAELKERVGDVLQRTTLRDLADRKRNKQAAEPALMYYI